MTYRKHDEVVVDVDAAPLALFDHLDDQERLAAHMEKPSMMMMGGAMSYGFDAARGRAVGSVIRMGGRFLWVELSVEEVVTERAPPMRKVWETRGAPRLVIIGRYRMGFEIGRTAAGSTLRVFIDYDYPPAWAGRVLGVLFAPFYAHWCVARMAKDAQVRFGRRRALAASAS